MPLTLRPLNQNCQLLETCKMTSSERWFQCLLSSLDLGWTKKFIWDFHKMLQKDWSKLLDQPNTFLFPLLSYQFSYVFKSKNFVFLEKIF